MAMQPFIKCGTRSNATARRLISSVKGPVDRERDEIEKVTIDMGHFMTPVHQAVSIGAFIANLYVPAGTKYYLIQSEISPNRFYCLFYSELFECWFCSSDNDRVKLKCIKKMKDYQNFDENTHKKITWDKEISLINK